MSESIIGGIDTSERSADVLRVAVPLSGLNARLVLLHVAQVPRVPGASGVPGAHEELREAALVEGYDSSNVSPTTSPYRPRRSSPSSLAIPSTESPRRRTMPRRNSSSSRSEVWERGSQPHSAAFPGRWPRRHLAPWSSCHPRRGAPDITARPALNRFAVSARSNLKVVEER